MKRNKTSKIIKTKSTYQESIEKPTFGLTPPKTLAERLGISPEILLGEPKITVTGDYMVEIVNHKGIISLSSEQIEVNTRKYIYKIQGSSLVITALTDEELAVFGKVEKIEKL